MEWIQALFAETRREPDDYPEALEVADSTLARWAKGYDEDEGTFALTKKNLGNVYSALEESDVWFEVEADSPKGWAFITESVEDRAIVAEAGPKGRGYRLSFYIVDTSEEDEEELEDEEEFEGRLYRYGFTEDTDFDSLPLETVGELQYDKRKYPSEMLDGYFESPDELSYGDLEYNDLWIIIDYPDGYFEHIKAVKEELTSPQGVFTNQDIDAGMWEWLEDYETEKGWDYTTAMDGLADALDGLHIVGTHGKLETAGLMAEVLQKSLEQVSRVPSAEEVRQALTRKATDEDVRELRRLMRYTVEEVEDWDVPDDWGDEWPEGYEELTPDSSRLDLAIQVLRYTPRLLGHRPILEYHASVEDGASSPRGVFTATSGTRRPGLIYDVGQRLWLVGDVEEYLRRSPGRFVQMSFWEIEPDFIELEDVPLYVNIPPPVEELPQSKRFAEEEMLVLIDGQEVVVPAMTRVNHPKHGKGYPLGGYGPGEELEIETEVGMVPALIISRVYTIPEERMETFVKRFEKMARKAAQLGAEPPTWREVGRFNEDVRTNNEIKDGEIPHYRLVHKVVVEGRGPTLKGWRFIGTIDPGEGELAKGTYLLKMVPGEIIPERFKDFSKVDPTHCDYCRKSRRRIKTFIVENEETGEDVQVGSNCIRDFLGHKSPQSIAQYLQWLDEPVEPDDGESEAYGPRVNRLYGIVPFLAFTNRAVIKYGWMSRGRARMLSERGENTMATADFVMWAITPTRELPYSQQSEQQAFRELISESDYDAARAALEWAPALWTPTDSFTPSDYGINMQSAVGDGLDGLVSYRSAGLAASLIAAYQKHLDQLHQRELEKLHGASKHIGTVGAREDVTVTIADIREFDNEWGRTRLIKMVTDEGNVLKWWYGGQDDYEVGDRYSGTCGIKKHGEFRGEKETTVQRCTLSPMNRAFAKVTKKQGEAITRAGVEAIQYLDDEQGDDLVLIDGTIFSVTQEGMPQLAAIMPALPKAVQTKIRAAVEKTDLRW